MIICARIIFAVYHTAIVIRNILNIAIGYIFSQCIVQLLPPFATHPILPSSIWSCSILYDYCHRLLHTQYCHQLYLCMAIAVIRYMSNIAVGYIIWNIFSDVSRVFLGRPVTSWSLPSTFPPRWLAEIFKPCASRCSKNALPGRACS